MLLSTIASTGAEPAGGAALGEVAIATGMATAVTALLLWLCAGHRSGSVRWLGRGADLAARLTGLPRWAALPIGVGATSLHVALLGMYWDISLHIDQGRDPGPLANPAHYLILVGLFGIFAAGVIAIALPLGDESPGPRPLRIARGWNAPVGGVLVAACGAFALTGFPLDDVWHRLFGQDVTLWGPTHLMLIGGAGMSLIGMAVLLGEAMHDRGAAVADGDGTGTGGGVGVGHRHTGTIVAVRRVAMMGGLLIGLSTFQAEFDFGVPQFRMVFQPLLIAFAAGFALTTARLWIGRGGALGAVAFFLAVRGIVAVLVGPVFGEVTPAMPLYVVEGLLVEAAALALARRPLALGAVAGVLCGTVGMAAEWGWTHLVFRLPWTTDILPEGALLAVAGGLAGGIFGALLATGLRGELPSARVARLLALGAMLVLAACVADGLVVSDATDARAAVTLVNGGRGGAEVRIAPDIADGSAWATLTAWQGRTRLHVDDLRRTGPGVYRADEPVPLTGSWKAMVRVQAGRAILAAPVRLPGDAAIPAPAVRAPRAGESRAFVADERVLQRFLAADRGDAAAELNAFHGSARSRRSGIVRTVQARASRRPSSSSQVTGTATGAPALARTL
jgi:hypothetical protein